MSYKVEHFSGNWYDEGYVFGTLEEAREYSLHRAIIPSRVVEATRESSMQSGVLANSPVNYTFKDGKLSPHKALLKSIVTWEDFVMAGGGCGTPYTLTPIAFRPMCDGCGNEIDPDCCGCGDSMEGHGSPFSAGHMPVPMGCDCFRA